MVEAGSGALVRRLLVDCGLGIRALDTRLAWAGLTASQIDAVFITHEHSDHIGCARQFALRHAKPVWMSHGTWVGFSEPVLGGWYRRAEDKQPNALGEY